MNKNKFYLLLLTTLFSCSEIPRSNADTNQDKDAYLWLEELSSDRSLAWVEAQNKKSVEVLEKDTAFEPLRTRLLSILNSNDRIPYVRKAGDYCYNFWKDENNVRGLFRRTTLTEYSKPDTKWETVFDLDAIAKAENENWTLKDFDFLYPTYDRLLVSLSRGGSDAKVVREFDLATKEFIPNGFFTPEAKTSVSWKDRDTLYVETDFGPGSLTDSGYPKMVKEWKRGTPITEAKLIFEGNQQDVSVRSWVVNDHGFHYEFISQSPSLFENNLYLHQGDAWIKLDKPSDVLPETHGEHLLFTLQTDWPLQDKVYRAGSLLALECEKFLKGDRSFHVLFEPTDTTCLKGNCDTKDFLIVETLESLRNKVFLFRWENGEWTKGDFEVPLYGSIGMSGIDPDDSNDYFLEHSDYLTPTNLWMGHLEDGSRTKLKSLPSFFSADDLEIQQHHAISKDGTRVPYFQISRKGLSPDTTHPTLLYGYGGFQVPLLPSYRPAQGVAWLEQGGIHVEANIRGGGEFGPQWHQAAQKENKQRSYDDFIAVAEDLIRRGVTSPLQLGIEGGSNGGLLVGAILTQRPDLCNAVLCHVPLLDMKRYHKLLAGASWLGEYGDPDKEEDWAFLQKYSPYHNMRENAIYPPVLFTTSTRDDRVHPGHARKMAAKMLDLGHQVLYYENTEGGHAGAANNEQVAYQTALAYMFLNQKLRPGPTIEQTN